jgi:hypothetical protein
MLFLYLLMTIAGIAWGFICLHRVLCPTFAILPRFDEIRDLTKMETSHLLYLILSAPVVWAFLLICSCLAVHQFLPTYRFSFFFGLVVALVFILAEFGEEKKKLETKFMSMLKKDLLSPLREPGSKYQPYSPLQMRMACWRATQLDAREFQNLTFECAACNRLRKISQVEICFRGTRRRYVVRCDQCREPSIIRIGGSMLSQYKAITEAYIPRSQEQIAQHQKKKPPGPKRVREVGHPPAKSVLSRPTTD